MMTANVSQIRGSSARGRKAVFMALAGMAAAAIAVPLAAQPSVLAMLDGLDKGAWTLRFRSGETSRSICLRTGRELIQIRHAQPGCSRVIVQDSPGEVTVQYSCTGNGYGRTNIRRESDDLVQIRSQGIYDGTPFAIDVEARRTGSC